ncbi:MAG: cytochrome C biogenesis protein [Anaerolineae bacterium]|nr:cytochrome C biogenesis protein [Anaerolineae bacterium]
MEVSVGLAFLAGMASFLSPCVFSLVPVYIGYLSGRSLSVSNSTFQVNKMDTFLHGLAFVLGFSAIFISLGAVASAIGGLLYDLRDWLARIGGIVVILFGLHMTGLLRIPFLEYDLRPRSKEDQIRSYFSSAMMGVFFSAGWSPCVGPVLGAILTLAMNGGSIGSGVQLLSAYSAGLAIPFLIAALGVGWVTRFLRKYGKVMHYIEIGMGVILIGVGVMLFFGVFNLLARIGPFVDFGL